jgi:hypothetical protein
VGGAFTCDDCEAETGCTYIEGAGTSYLYCANRLNWANAQAACEAIGGNLLVVKRAAEYDLFTDLGTYWLGGYDPDGDNVFEWVDGTPVEYDGWLNNQPDSVGQGCMQFWNGAWDDLQCGNTRAYICEGGQPNGIGDACEIAECSANADCAEGEACYDGFCAAAPTCPADDRFEENNESAAATVITSGRYSGGIICEDDPDYFQFDICAGGSFEANLYFTHAEGDLELQLLLNDVNQDVSQSVNDNEQVSRDNVGSDRTYTLHVFGFDGASNDYELELIIEGCDN